MAMLLCVLGAVEVIARRSGNRHRGQNARADIPHLAEETLERDASAAVDQFTRKAASEGWLLAVDGHFCPSCYKEMVARDQKRMEQLQKAMTEERGARTKDLVQIGGTPADIKRASELEERRRRLTTGLKTGLGGVQ